MKRLSWVSGRSISCAAVVVFCVSIIAQSSEGVVVSPQDLWEQQYQELGDQITRNRSLAKKSTSSEMKIIDRQALILPSDGDPLDVMVRRTRSLLEHVRGQSGTAELATLARRLEKIEQSMRSAGLSKSSATGVVDARKELFKQAAALQREVAMANPLMDFDSLLFIECNFNISAHVCFQYNTGGSNGGGLYMLTGLKSGTIRRVDILANSTVQNGRLRGQRLSGGGFLSPDLDFDGNRITFAYSDNDCYHVFTVNKDGSNLVQLTDGVEPTSGLALWNVRQNDFDPCWLPNGRIVCISGRRGGYGRCHDGNGPAYTLYSMKSDGTDMIPISYHETNEWQPSVDNDGRIVYSRWDYIDRDDCISHNLWICGPDGSDPRAPHGNYPEPLTTIGSYNGSDGRRARPNTELGFRSIPGSGKYVALGTAHHTRNVGHVIMIDYSVEDDNKMSQITGITTNQTYWDDPWSADGSGQVGPYSTPWALSENYYLCNKDNTLILRDRFGGETVLYSSGGYRPLDPIPLRPRERPPVLVTKTFQGARANLPEKKPATISVMNVNITDWAWPAGMTPKYLRVMQVFVKPTAHRHDPIIGYGAESLARMCLGTYPIEADGSVYGEAPVGKEIYFQLLDENGVAIHSMRSGTYVHPGEQLSCVGCHENKWRAVPPMNPLATRRPPSKLTPDAGGVEPINFHRLVKPVFQSKCAPCHQQQGRGPDMSYGSLDRYAFYFCSNTSNYLNGDIVSARVGGSRTYPGRFGARESGLYSYLSSSHYNVNLTVEERRRITLWLDANSNELGAYTRVNEQRQGQLVWAEMDCDPANPTGTEFPVDATPPTVAPGGLTATAVSDTQINLSWNAVPASADPQSGIAGYAVFRNGTMSATVATTSYSAVGLSELTTYTFEVAAINGAGGTGPRASVQATTLGDRIPPVITSVASLGTSRVSVSFSEKVTQASAQIAANYSIGSGVTVQSATLESNQSSVTLQTAGAIADQTYRLSVTGVIDQSAARNVANDTASFKVTSLISGLTYEYYEGTWSSLPAFSALTPVRTGVTSSIGLSVSQRTENYGLRFSGFIQVPQTGTYTFFTSSDDGSALLIDGTKIVDNDGMHAPTEKSGSVTLIAGYHSIAVHFFQGGGGQELSVQWSSASIPKQPFSSAVLFHQPSGTTMSKMPGTAMEHGLSVVASRPGSGQHVVRFRVPGSERSGIMRVKIYLYNMRGNEVARVFDAGVAPGCYTVAFTPSGSNGFRLTSGQYFCRMQAAGFDKSVPVIVVR